MNKISAFIVAYHEDRVIVRCLKSLVGIVDEIIVIHDGPCRDRTIEISKKFTDKVYEMPVNKGIGESHYIFAFKHCKYDWILRIDADEFISSELRKKIRKLVEDKTISAYAFIWPFWNGKKYITDGWPYKNFLFRKKSIGFLDKFHYPIKVNGAVKKIDLKVHHKPFYNNFTNKIFKEKTMKWCKLQARDHLIPLENCEIYNLDIKQLIVEQKKKDLVYKYPLVCGLFAFLTSMAELISKPGLFFQSGFWITSYFSSKYSYNVAKEVVNLKKN